MGRAFFFGVADFLTEFNVPVYGHKNDIDLAQNASKNRWRVRAKDCTFTNFINDGDKIVFDGFEIDVMHTPGHTMGSVCYIVENDRVLISGDTLFCMTAGRTDLYGGNEEMMIESLKKLIALEGDYRVLPGHNRETTLERERTRNWYIRRMVK